MENYISLENVQLHYSSHAFRETSLKSFLFKAFSKNKIKPKSDDVHALKNINLKINSGERVALLGHNGAGKSTLLKTIAGLYPISGGQRDVHGRIRSLFELNLGFEYEATGRENIMYRGLMLGKRPKEIREVQQEIINFAALGEFIDYPIKTYSAGMVVRLAFAISTMVEGDILLLDEFLGAGDASFMVKAKKRIMSLIENARIMILASHDLSSIQQICTRALLLKHGEIIFDGDVGQAIEKHKELMASS